ncbi:Prefoldin beta-like protein [Aduncisulcus paluster]|uniref:Prefoldin beta-like protein n=1 Tax=Aduncisulcus paluster TaxID=2918883 RepID=A0ABQ5KB22_9EUKA|nr:Prefoldin beta-like protein [Aduncisulcus paluster]
MDPVKAKIFTDAKERLEKSQKDRVKLVQSYEALATQLEETKMAKSEVDLLEEDDKISRLMGPVLIPQTVEEALEYLGHRIGFIEEELKRTQKRIDDADKMTETASMELQKAHDALKTGKK